MRVRDGIILVLVVSLGGISRAAPNSQIDGMIARGKAYLYSQQQSDGTWEQTSKRDKADTGQDIKGAQWGGTTAICVDALLASGENPQGPKLERAIDFLKRAQLVGVYALGMRCQAWLLLPQTPEVKAAMKRDAAALIAMVKQEKGPARGFYDYTKEAGNTYSLSRAQYAVQGLWAAAQVGVDVPEAYWKLVESAWVDQQQRDGGWAYCLGKDYPATAGITSVGVATLMITQEFLHARDGLECRGNITSPPIEAGLRWLADHMDDVASAQKPKRGSRAYPYATLYGVERAGVATGRRYFGDVSWYAKGSDWLLGKQKRDGSWPVDSMIGNLPDTCFALLFLARGRAPLAMSKLEYFADAKTPGNWNQRPRDVAGATRWIGRQIERELNWQTLTLDAPLEDLSDAPILFVAGDKPLKFTDAQRRKLKSYVESGGLVLGSADCASRGFTSSFQKLGEELFPACKFRELPADHVIYTNQQFFREKWKTKPSVLGLSNGVRELMLLIPQADAGRAWQSPQADRPEMLQLAADVFLYAADRRHLRLKGDTNFIARRDGVPARTSIRVARIRYTGNWDPEPAGWRRLADEMHNRGVDVTVEPVAIEDATSLTQYRVAHLTGTDAMPWNDAARDALRSFVAGGGTLVVDAAGGATAFSKSIEPELPKLLAGAPPCLALPSDHPVYLDGKKPIPIGYRAYARRVVGDETKAGRLCGMTSNGRTAVFFSREDLTAGLVGSPVDGIIGYDPETSLRLMSGILEYAVR